MDMSFIDNVSQLVDQKIQKVVPRIEKEVQLTIKNVRDMTSRYLRLAATVLGIYLLLLLLIIIMQIVSLVLVIRLCK